MNKFYIDIKNTGNKNAGNKARKDVCNILNRNEYIGIEFGYDTGWKRRLYEKFLGKIYVKNLLKDVKEYSTVIIQYPLYSNNTNDIIHELKRKNCKVVGLIHDINGLRHEKYKFNNEIHILNKMDMLISHNKSMTDILIKNGLKTRCISLNIFDYLSDIENNINKIKFCDQIIFAGNLSREKCGFIYELDDEISLNLYGVGYEGDNNKINYKGAFNPDDLQKELEGGFGLVWDGPSIDGCKGVFGEYLRYNNPHKLSLYISANIPVIVWKEAAVADFVIKNNLGIAINSISEIKDILLKMDKNEYYEIKKNVELIGKKLRRGEMLESIIKNLNI